MPGDPDLQLCVWIRLRHLRGDDEESDRGCRRPPGRALVEARAEAREVQIETIAAEGQPAKVLVEVAKGANLLVVGSRGFGGFQELLLGSVSQQCANTPRAQS
ncbi:MAG TPA: universal stress protein [Actinomycetota bacterium]